MKWNDYQVMGFVVKHLIKFISSDFRLFIDLLTKSFPWALLLFKRTVSVPDTWHVIPHPGTPLNAVGFPKDVTFSNWQKKIIYHMMPEQRSFWNLKVEFKQLKSGIIKTIYNTQTSLARFTTAAPRGCSLAFSAVPTIAMSLRNDIPLPPWSLVHSCSHTTRGWP